MWYKQFPTCAKSTTPQCPINLQTQEAIETTFPPLVFVPNKLNEMKIENVGHTIQMSCVDPNDAPILTGGPLKCPYKFAQFHFHWPCETQVNGEK